MADDRADWLADVERACDEHDPALEPYASMTKDELRALMQDDSLAAGDYERLRQHFLDKCSGSELERFTLHDRLTMWLIEERGTNGMQQALHCRRVAVAAIDQLIDGMPAPGPAHEIN